MDGITHLLSDDYDLVPESAYGQFGAQEVVITMENWEQYFEIVETTNPTYNDFGDIEYLNLGYFIILRDAYAQKLPAGWYPDITFKTYVETAFRKVDGDFPNDFTLGELCTLPWYELEPQNNAEALNYFDPSYTSEASPMYSKYATSGMYAYTVEYNKANYVEYPTVFEVTDVTGTLMLYP